MPLQFSKKFLGAITLGVLTVGVVTGLVLTRQQSDTRQQASIPNGIVEVAFVPAQSPLTPGTTNTVNISANTHDLQILGFQLKFQVLGQFSTAPTIDLVSNTGFAYTSIGSTTATPVITPISGGYEITLAVISSAGLGQSVSTSQATNVLQLHLSPTLAQNISVVFDNQFSQALDITPQNADQLNTLQNMTFAVAAAGATPTNTPIVQGTATIAPTVPPGSTATPISTATPGNTCNTIAAINSADGSVLQSVPQVGQVIAFECGLINGAARYEFRLKRPGQTTYSNLSLIDPNARRSVPVTISVAGDYSAQCRMCTGTDALSCQQWE